jgi:hypothetical protein
MVLFEALEVPSHGVKSTGCPAIVFLTVIRICFTEDRSLLARVTTEPDISKLLCVVFNPAYMVSLLLSTENYLALCSV